MVRRRGVTLIELMVVLGIVLVLIAILVPVLAAARRRARDADTTNQLEALRGACEGYYAMFKAYPGPMMESDVAGDMGFTGSQNLTLGVVGSMYKASTSNTPLNLVGANGAFGTVPLPKMPDGRFELYGANEPRGVYDTSEGIWHASFYAPRAGELLQVSGVKAAVNPLYTGGAATVATLPMFHDRYLDPLPVLYFRRAYDVVTPVVAEGAGSAAYSRMSNTGLLDSTGLVSSSGRTCGQGESGYASGNVSAGVSGGFGTHLEQTLTDMTSETGNASSRKARGRFVLISAGQDRVYGPVVRGGVKVSESDDIVVFGGN